MFLSKVKYNDLVASVKNAQSAAATAKNELCKRDNAIKNLEEENNNLKITIAEYENNECCDCECECEASDAKVKKEGLVKWVNEYIADDLKFINNNKLRAFVASQIALELGTPAPTEFTTDIADENLERIVHIMYAAVTLDSYLGAEGLTIRKK